MQPARKYEKVLTPFCISEIVLTDTAGTVISNKQSQTSLNINRSKYQLCHGGNLGFNVSSEICLGPRLAVSLRSGGGTR